MKNIQTKIATCTIDHWCGSSLKQFFPSCHGSQQDEHVSNDAVFNRRRGQEN